MICCRTPFYRILLLLTLFGILGCDSDDDTTTAPRTTDAYFSSTEVVYNNSTDMIWIESDLTIVGYQHRDRMLAGAYWYRKNNEGDYYYVTAACQTNVPNNYLGHQSLVDIPYESTFYDQTQFCITHEDCFSERTGIYYGKVKLYDTKSVGIDPNTSPLAVSIWVSFSWTSAKGTDEPSTISVWKVTEEEQAELDALSLAPSF